MLPLPYGLIPHEAIEIIDNERIIPGITKAFKMAEDFPYLDLYSINKSKEDTENFYQCVYFYNEKSRLKENHLLQMTTNLPR
jgi:hypothetical protein